jgi:hypothetical protein
MLRAGAVGAGAASRYGSGSTKMMRLLLKKHKKKHLNLVRSSTNFIILTSVLKNQIQNEEVVKTCVSKMYCNF